MWDGEDGKRLRGPIGATIASRVFGADGGHLATLLGDSGLSGWGSGRDGRVIPDLVQDREGPWT